MTLATFVVDFMIFCDTENQMAVSSKSFKDFPDHRLPKFVVWNSADSLDLFLPDH
jgi:hypothetical protein